VKYLKEKLEKLSVLVFGDMYLDRDCIGNFEGKSKEDEKLSILKVFAEKYQPGGGGNLASCFASLGVKTTVVGLWGEKDDINRQILEKQFEDRNISTLFMVESGKTPVFGKFYIQNGKHIFRYDIVFENMTDKIEKTLSNKIKRSLYGVDFVACADYNNSGIRDTVCKNALTPILISDMNKFATGRKDINKFKGFDNILLNDEEFIDRYNGKDETHLLEVLNTKSLTITSEGGAITYSNGIKYKSNSKQLIGEIDTCGCGDMFYAMYASSIMAGYNINISLKLANCAAGIVAKKLFGAAQASIDEVIDSL